MPDVELARRTGVELVRTGSWGVLTGTWTPNRDDILAAVEASKCPAVRRPRIKLGHLDPRFNRGAQLGAEYDGTPALGWYDNLRADDDGNTLVADQVALPWLSSVQAAAYPDRSIEGNYRVRCALGHTHPFVIKAVSLLGETDPGIPTLKSIEDLPEFLGVAAAGEPVEEGEAVEATIRAAAPAPDGDGDDDDEPTGAMVALILTVEDAARLAVDGGEPADQLHLTLAYLGDAADLDASDRQDLIDTVSSVVNGMPIVNGEIFSVAVYNPGDTTDRDTCLVYQASGELLDDLQDALDDALGDPDFSPEPWFAHITAIYSDDLGRLPDLIANIGAVTFDRVRIAIAGQTVDIPLLDYATASNVEDAGDYEAEPSYGYAPVMAADMPGKGNPGALKSFWTKSAKGLAQWASSPHPWTSLYHNLLKYLPDDEAKRTAAQWYHTVFKTWPGSKSASKSGVHASAEPSPDLPAAEPEQEETPIEEDSVSLSDDMRSRLGLADDADETAALAAIDELISRADKPAEPTEEMVAASAAATKKAEQAEAEKTVLASAVEKLTEQVTSISGELATVRAEKAATVKASVIGDAVREGKIKPADREQWESDYDEAPSVTTRILASIAPGTAVPVTAAGTIGDPEPVMASDGFDEAMAKAWASELGVSEEEFSRG